MTILFKDDSQKWQATENSHPSACEIARVPASPLCSGAWVIFLLFPPHTLKRRQQAVGKYFYG